MMTCPNCGKPVDPLRAPAVGVREGKVVSYCSKECATAVESKSTNVLTGPTARAVAVIAPIQQQTGKVKKTATPATGVVQPIASYDSGPVIEIIREPSSGARRAADDTKTKGKAADDGIGGDSVQIADTGHLDDYVSQERPKRGARVIVALVVVVAGAAAAAHLLGAFGNKQEDAPRAPARLDAGTVAVVVDAAPAVTPETAIAQAQDVLRGHMRSSTPRVQRMAAAALARSGDKEALDALAKAMATETGDLARLELAHALARGNDKRGLDALLAAARGGKRDPKLEAGRRLAALRDKRATDAIVGYLAVVQVRLGTAEHLAYLAEPRALKVLDEIRLDPKSLPDEKARATIALGRAGRSDVLPELRTLLADDRNNAFASVVLADMKDESARPVLVKQLMIPSLRAQAAGALRRLSPEANVTALLPPLVAALASNKDTEQVQIAESILLLAGPPDWSGKE